MPSAYASKFARFSGCCFWAALTAAQGQVNVTTFHNNNARDGQNLSETALTLENVAPNYFGQLFVHPADGYIYAQPLYVSNVQIAGGTHNVVYVATAHDSVYAFDADNTVGANANPLWQVSFINPAAGITTVSNTDLNCGDIVPEVGVIGTPVIDLSSGTLYVVAKTKENGAYFQRLHALDITSGTEKFGGPVVIQATVNGTGSGSSGGHITFDPKLQNQRAGLLLENGTVYLTWAAHCDITPFHGWMMAYNAQTLQQTAIWNSTPNGSDGGVWQSGAPPAADANGNIFLITGNGSFDLNMAGGQDAGDSFLRLGPPSGGAFPILDYFTPYNQSSLAATDADLGSGGAMLLPDQPQGSPHQHLIVGVGKQGTLYLVDRDSMGHFNASNDSQIVQWMPGLIGGLWATPAFWNNTLYFGGADDELEAFSFNADGRGLISTQPVSASEESFNYPGITPSISANGNSDAIVWALERGDTAVLHAYEATNLSHELYSSSQDGQSSPGLPVKFAVPTIANGKAYVGTTAQLAVYGLLAGVFTSPAPGFELSSPTATFTWGPVRDATQYQLSVGTSPSAANIFSGATTGTSQTVGFIPCSGGTVYVQLAAAVDGSMQQVSSYSYKCKSGAGDFNADGSEDLVWQNDATGQVNVNYFGGVGPQPQGSAVLDNGASLAGWKVVGAADFDRNGTADLVVQNNATGQVNVNYYNGSTRLSSAVLNSGAGTAGWSVVAVADMNGDGAPDLIWQNSSTGQVNVNYYSGSGGATLTGFAVLNSGAGTAGWKVVAAADFDGNGVPDLVWQNQSSGQVNVNYYGGSNKTTLTGFAVLNSGAGTVGWSLITAADMNADNVPDLIWQNNTTLQVNVNYYGGGGGAVLKGFNCLNCSSSFVGSTLRVAAGFGNSGEPGLVWQNNTTSAVTVYYYGLGGSIYQSWALLNGGSGTAGWHVVGSGDFDSNGVPDLVWQNTSTGQVNVNYYGGAGGSTLTGFAVLNSGAGTSGWSVVAVADMNGDGVPDLIWQNGSTGQVNANYYGGAGGAALTGWAELNTGAGTGGWKVVAAADFDGNGVPDLIWQNTSSRQVNVNYYGGSNHTTLIDFAVLNSGSGAAGWSVVGASDFDGNGVPDLVWRNDSQGQVNVNYYGGARGASYKGWNVLNGAANPGWSVIVPRSR